MNRFLIFGSVPVDGLGCRVDGLGNRVNEYHWEEVVRPMAQDVAEVDGVMGGGLGGVRVAKDAIQFDLGYGV